LLAKQGADAAADRIWELTGAALCSVPLPRETVKEIIDQCTPSKNELRKAFDAIDTELGWFLGKMEADAARVQKYADRSPVTAELMKTFAAVLRKYCDMARGIKEEETRIILPFGPPGKVNGS
jgi:hypothetical protein